MSETNNSNSKKAPVPPAGKATPVVGVPPSQNAAPAVEVPPASPAGSTSSVPPVFSFCFSPTASPSRASSKKKKKKTEADRAQAHKSGKVKDKVNGGKKKGKTREEVVQQRRNMAPPVAAAAPAVVAAAAPQYVATTNDMELMKVLTTMPVMGPTPELLDFVYKNPQLIEILLKIPHDELQARYKEIYHSVGSDQNSILEMEARKEKSTLALCEFTSESTTLLLQMDELQTRSDIVTSNISRHTKLLNDANTGKVLLENTVGVKNMELFVLENIIKRNPTCCPFKGPVLLDTVRQVIALPDWEAVMALDGDDVMEYLHILLALGLLLNFEFIALFTYADAAFKSRNGYVPYIRMRNVDTHSLHIRIADYLNIPVNLPGFSGFIAPPSATAPTSSPESQASEDTSDDGATATATGFEDATAEQLKQARDQLDAAIKKKEEA